MDEPMIEEDIRNVQGSCLGRWYCSIQLGILVGNDMYVLVPLCCFGKRFLNIYCDKFRWPRYWKELQLTAMAVLGVVYCAAWACAYCLVDVFDRVGLVKAVMYCALHPH